MTLSESIALISRHSDRYGDKRIELLELAGVNGTKDLTKEDADEYIAAHGWQEAAQ